MTCHRQRSTKL